VIGSGDDHGVDRLVIQHPAEILDELGTLTLRLFELRAGFG
jgi:hypothetical protein